MQDPENQDKRTLPLSERKKVKILMVPTRRIVMFHNKLGRDIFAGMLIAIFCILICFQAGVFPEDYLWIFEIVSGIVMLVTVIVLSTFQICCCVPSNIY